MRLIDGVFGCVSDYTLQDAKDLQHVMGFVFGPGFDFSDPDFIFQAHVLREVFRKYNSETMMENKKYEGLNEEDKSIRAMHNALNYVSYRLRKPSKE